MTSIENLLRQSLLEANSDFLFISDNAAHPGLNVYKIVVAANAVFASITAGGVEVVAAKGLTGKTVPVGTELPFGNAHATAITLTSGSIVAYLP